MDLEMMQSSSDEQIGPSDDEAEVVTPYEVLIKLTNGWMNEKISPELLQPLGHEVECMLQQMKLEEDKISKLQPMEEAIRHMQLEVERIRFLVTSYLRTRLAKIQKYCWFINDQEMKRGPQVPSRLTPEESKFLRGYLGIVELHFHDAACVHMPGKMGTLKRERMMVVPNLDTFVFVRVNKPADVTLDDAEGKRSEQVKLRPGGQLIMKYRPLSSLVERSDVQLV